jgi:hypothetical protein
VPRRRFGAGAPSHHCIATSPGRINDLVRRFG